MANRRLFVAGPSSIRDQVRDIIDVCREAGWEITEDWTRSNSWDRPVTREVLVEANAINRVAVLSADALLWICHDQHPSAGAAYEACLAECCHKPVAILWLDQSRQGAGACYALREYDWHALSTPVYLICRALEDLLEALKATFATEVTS